jgi:hypothetical protein
MKTYDHYMFVSSEASNNVLIVDLSPLPDSARVVGTTMDLDTEPHNIFIDTAQAVLFVIEDFNFSKTRTMSSHRTPGCTSRREATDPSASSISAIRRTQHCSSG